MLLPAPPLYPSRRKPKAKKPSKLPTPPPAALTLVSAMYAEGQWVDLTFDRAVDIDAIVVTEIIVDDAATSGSQWRGTGTATLVDPVTVRVPVSEWSVAVGTGTDLIASAATGIVAVDDGGTWAGVTMLALPFP